MASISAWAAAVGLRLVHRFDQGRGVDARSEGALVAAKASIVVRPPR